MNRSVWLGVAFGAVTVGVAYGCVGDTSSVVDSGTDSSVADVGADTTVTDSGSDVVQAQDGDASPPPPGPNVIFGNNKLVLWLDADDTSTVVLPDGGTSVIAWKDRSTFGNDANVVYSNDASAITVEKLAINGHSAMKLSGNFSATGLFDVPDKTSLQWGTSDFMIAMVVAYANTPGVDEYGGRGQLWGKSSGGWPYWGVGMAANAYSAPLADGGIGGPDSVIFGGIESFAAGSAAGAWSSKDGWNDGAFHAFTMRKDTTNKAVFIRTDGTETSSTQNIDTTQNLSAIGTDVQIGGYANGTTCCYSPLRGYIAEIIAVRNTSGTTLELNELGAYITAKYGITY